MKYGIDLLKNHGFDVNWITVYVGCKLDFISISEVTKFTINYLDKNVQEKNNDILQLAWDVSSHDDVLNLLESIITNRYNNYMVDQESDEWIREVRKWRFCDLSLALNLEGDDLFQEIEAIFSKYNCPEDMFNLFREISDIHYYSTDSDLNNNLTMKNLIGRFLQLEKELI